MSVRNSFPLVGMVAFPQHKAYADHIHITPAYLPYDEKRLAIGSRSSSYNLCSPDHMKNHARHSHWVRPPFSARYFAVG